MSMLGKMIVRRKTMLFVVFLAVAVFATFASGIKAQCPGPGCGGVDVTNPFAGLSGPGSLSGSLEELQKESAEEDKCVLITPGMSENNGELYGVSEVRAKNDLNDYQPEVIARCSLLARAEDSAPKFSDVENWPSDICTWAVDYSGKTAANRTEDDLNFRIRETQNTENVDKFAVTTNNDLEMITPTGANSEIRTSDEQYAGQSNEQINEENARKGGGNVTLVPPDGPSKVQHEEYYFGSGQNNRGYTVPDGKKMKAGAPYVINKKGQTDADGAEVEVTKDCVFQDPSTEPPTLPDPFSGWPVDDGGSGGGSGGGGDDGGGGGMLDKLMQALMQALQGIKGGGGQGDNPSPAPTPLASPMPSEDIAAITSDSVSTLTDLIQQLTTSGIPDSQLDSVTNIVTNLVTSILSNGGSVPQTNVPTEI